MRTLNFDDSFVRTSILHISDPSSLYRLLCETEDVDNDVVRQEIKHLARYENQLTYKDTSQEYYGQTALHIAVARMELFPLKTILSGVKEMKLECTFSTCATGTTPKFTCFLGETPIAAALISNILTNGTLDPGSTLDTLLAHGADAMQTNSRGDTILHSIVRFSKLVDKDLTESLNKILASQKQNEFSEKLKTCSRLQNLENCTPLQLALKVSAVPMIHWLIETFHQRQIFVDGKSHIEAYSVTELDTVTHRIISATPKDGDDTKRDRDDWRYKRIWKPRIPSGLEMMFANTFPSEYALDMMNIKCVKCLIKEKWRQERLIFYTFGIVYFLALLLITVYSVYRKDVNISNFSTTCNGSIHNLDTRKFSKFLEALLIVSTIISILALLLSTTLLTSRLFFKPDPLFQALHNIDYTFMFLSFAILLFFDCLLVNVKRNYDFEYNGELLLISLIFGWSFSTLFLRIFINCGHLIDLLRQVTITHLISFLCITTIINIAFGACFFDLMRYVENDSGIITENENFKYFGRTMYTMFTLTLGLNEIEAILSSPNSWLVILLFIIFMVIVYLLILNFLIAVMTETCTRIFSRRKEQHTLHMLSSILFIEDMFLLSVLFLPPLQKLRVKGFRKNAPKAHKLADNINIREEDQLAEISSKPGDVAYAGHENKSGSYTPSFELCFRRNKPLPLTKM